ncbi:zinc/manganese transport system substrate-binding protein [Leucobacter luti]|uniref:metal ABC transporter substrate-binding protein n=1 Tax=Leucobacter luti TaxID=340320 RepID=UPI001050C92C|nr:metal ABC transporter substrate-binding protein [Leucobacter luti]MCW2288385.1 zinc/manganese transport system substrate-binding protein [Leucobacter luti]TCK45458.1 zinc/manganese transport system substrate-binding protein [Leucobacter luti]
MSTIVRQRVHSGPRGIRGFLAATVTATLIATLAGCAIQGQPELAGAGQDLPEVVVTTNILGDVVSQVLGDAAHVTTLMRPNADPHSFEISASEAALLDRAALVVSNGFRLEEGLQQHLDRVRQAGTPMFVAGDHIESIPYASTDSGAGGSGSGCGSGSGDPDPHFWTDPGRMVDVVEALTTTLTDASAVAGFNTADRAAIATRGEAYAGQLRELDSEMAEQFSAIPSERRALITNHHVFGYLADRYDFRVLGTAIPGGTTLAAPSAADLRELVDAITNANVPAIFAESSAPDRLMRVLAEEAGIDVQVIELFTESLSLPGAGAETYVEMLTTNTARIADGLDPDALQLPTDRSAQ